MSWTIIDTDHLRKIALFSNLSERTLEILATLIYTRQFRPGQRVFENGAQAKRMYFINQGEVRISRQIPGFESEVLAVLHEGSYFGESALILDATRSADAWAWTECSLGIIEGDELKEVMHQELDLAEELLWIFVRTLSGRLRMTNNKVTELVEGMHQ